MHTKFQVPAISTYFLVVGYLKPLEKYQPSPSKKNPVYKNNVIHCISFNNPEKSQPSKKSLNPYTGYT